MHPSGKPSREDHHYEVYHYMYFHDILHTLKALQRKKNQMENTAGLTWYILSDEVVNV